MNYALNSAIFGLSVVGLSMMASPAHALSFTNGGFANNNLSAGTSGFIGGGQVVINGWTFNNGYSFLIPDGTDATTNINEANSGLDPVYGTPIQNPDGAPISLWGDAPVNSADGSGWFIAADGAYGPEAFISQTVSGLTVGSQYTVSFYQAHAQQRGCSGTTTSGWDVSFGWDTFSSPTMIHASMDPVSGWQKVTTSFTASGSSEVLKFLATGSPAGLPPFALLSGISVTDTPTTPVPTPALLPGLVGMGVAAWRKRKGESEEA